MRIGVSCIALAVLAAGTTSAQRTTAPTPKSSSRDVSWVHESWTARDGLPVNSINAIIQDRTGYIWAATWDGLVRFDGVRFTVFNSSKSEALPSNRIVRMKEGRDGSLWLVTEQGHLVRFHDGTFTNYPFDNAQSAEGDVQLLVDSGGTVWVGEKHGLWSVRGDHFVPVGRETLHAPVTSIMQRRDGTLSVGTGAAGLFRVTADGRVTRTVANPALVADTVLGMYEDAAGSLWMAGVRRLWSWRDRLETVTLPNAQPIQTPISVNLLVQVPATGALFAQVAARVYHIDSGIAVLVRDTANLGGLRLWADSQAVWDVVGQNVFRDGRLVLTLPERRIVSAALFDREGSLWLGTDAGGLHRLKRALFTTYSVAEGVSYPNIYATYVDRSGAIWLGNWGKGGADRLDPVTGRVVAIGTDLPSVSNTFYEDAAGTLWIGAGGGLGGVYACTPSTMACRAEGPTDLRSKFVYALYGDGDGRLWAGTTGGLFRFDGRSWTHLPPSSGVPNATVRAFASTRDGALWMGTNGGGLARYREGTFTPVTRADGLPSDLIRSLYADADGWLWVGTEGRGLARLDPRAWESGSSMRNSGDRRAVSPDSRLATPDSRVVRITADDGLYDEVIHQILEDQFGRLWMNTNRGIFWVARSELNAFADGRISRIHSTAYSERDGMRNREGNGGVQPAGAKGRDGRLWFPTQDGVVVVDPAKVSGDRHAPPLVVEQVVTTRGPLRPQRDSIALAPDQRDVQIEYTALTFLEPANVRFRYRLEQYDAGWVDAGGRRTAFYTKLPPGRYTFRVEASDATGGWHEPGAMLGVRVVPRYWETGFFRWASVFALGALVLVAFRFREARLRARALELEQVVDERTWALRERETELAQRNAQLQSLDHAKTRFFANVSHEFRTPLTLTIGPLEDLRAHAGGDPKVERWLDIALRNARRLLRLVNQILDVAKLEAGAMHLTPRPLDLAPFTRGVVAAFAPVAEHKGISLTTVTPDALAGAFDADAVEKILTNLVSNAIKFTPNGGTVRVILTRDGDAARLLVGDSGPGIPPDQLPHVFERFYQVDESTTRAHLGTGIGLSLVKELVELHGGRVTVESGSSGTTFTATIPSGDGPDAVAVPDDAQIPTAASLANAVTAERSASLAESSEQDDRAQDVPTLLVVDDSADLRDYIRDHFTARFRVLEAGDGAEGITLARVHLPDVVISDVMMPGTDGHELVRTLRASPETDFLAIVLLTARAEDAQRIEGLEHGADEYMVKPFEMRELDVRVRNLIASRRRLRDRFASVPMDAHPVSVAMLPADEAYAARVRDAIQRHLADPDFGVGQLADEVAQDRSHLFRRVRQVFGESPSDLIKRMRLEQGARLLVEDSGTVTDVAYAVGFNSLSYFCRCFQDAFGVTPAAYRSRVVVAR